MLDLNTGVLEYCNAGHNAPVLLPSDRSVKEVEVLPNLPLGVMSGFTFTAQKTKMQPDDVLFLYTDGLTEAENIRHELFGEERMNGVLAAAKGEELGPRNLVMKMQEAVTAYVGEAQQSDDLTMLAVRYQRPAIVMRNDIQQIPTLSEWIEGLDIPKELNMPVNLALEEAVTNVMLYAYPGQRDGKVFVEYAENHNEHEKTLVFTISDCGVPFDPTQAPEADISLSAEERAIGGLGIHLVRQLMDEIRYERVEEKNVLTLVKRIER